MKDGRTRDTQGARANHDNVKAALELAGRKVSSHINETIPMPLVRPLDERRQAPPNPKATLANFDRVKEAALGGDVPSMIAVFEATQWCVGEKYNLVQARAMRAHGAELPQDYLQELTANEKTCTKAPSTAIQSRFDFLERAASAGNKEAMLMYEKNLTSSAIQDPTWLLKNAENLAYMKQTAIIFLQNAAAGGVQEANERLADLYRSGMYGTVDLSLAQQYLERIPLQSRVNPTQ